MVATAVAAPSTHADQANYSRDSGCHVWRGLFKSSFVYISVVQLTYVLNEKMNADGYYNGRSDISGSLQLGPILITVTALLLFYKLRFGKVILTVLYHNMPFSKVKSRRNHAVL